MYHASRPQKLGQQYHYVPNGTAQCCKSPLSEDKFNILFRPLLAGRHLSVSLLKQWGSAKKPRSHTLRILALLSKQL